MAQSAQVMHTLHNEHHITVRATTIIGTKVENWDGEDLGKIEDVVIDKLHGDVQYLILEYPGTYGPEWLQKRFAVPFESLGMRRVAGGEVEYILNVDESFLKKAPGFDCDDRPDFADPSFTSVLKDYYKEVKVDMRV